MIVPRTPTDRQRRRGADLEDAILAAAWLEIVEHGWSSFSVPRVAERAGAGKASLYRRWPNKATLVAAAAKREGGRVPGPLDLSGSLVDNLELLLLGTAEFLQGPFGSVARALAAELPSIPAADRVVFDDTEPVRVALAIIDHARDQGEIGPGAVPASVVNVGHALLLQRFLFHVTPPSGQEIAEIVHAIWIPAIHAAAGAAG